MAYASAADPTHILLPNLPPHLLPLSVPPYLFSAPVLDISALAGVMTAAGIQGKAPSHHLPTSKPAPCTLQSASNSTHKQEFDSAQIPLYALPKSCKSNPEQHIVYIIVLTLGVKESSHPKYIWPPFKYPDTKLVISF